MAIDYSKIQHEDVTDTYFYVNLPSQFFHDRASGKITPLMFDCLAWIWEHAGYSTGRTKMTSAGRIQADLWPRKKGRPSVRSIQRALRILHHCGYITLPMRFLHEESYSIRANNYVIYDNERKLALYPKVTIGCRELKEGSEEAYYDDSCDRVQAEIGQSSGRVPAEFRQSWVEVLTQVVTQWHEPQLQVLRKDTVAQRTVVTHLLTEMRRTCVAAVTQLCRSSVGAVTTIQQVNQVQQVK
jgi:hypothetical protein